MMECSKKLMTEIQNDIDSFILRTSSHWISKDIIHLPQELGGLGAIKIETYAISLRCSWYKRVKSGLWTEIMMAKVNKKENIYYVKENDCLQYFIIYLLNLFIKDTRKG